MYRAFGFVLVFFLFAAAPARAQVVVIPLLSGSELPKEWVIPPAAFQPEVETVDYSLTQILTNNGSFQCFSAPAYLPDGVTVSAIKGVFSVGVNNNDATAELYRHKFADGLSGGTALNATKIGSITQSISPTATLKEISDTSVGDGPINNAVYTYTARICLQSGDTFWAYIIETE